MRVPVIFRWKGSRSIHFQGEGSTRDISVAGVYVLTATCPSVNSIMQMEVVLPRLHGAAKTRIKADMKVLRIEHDIAGEGRCGFSAVGKSWRYAPSRSKHQTRSKIQLRDLRD